MVSIRGEVQYTLLLLISKTLQKMKGKNWALYIPCPPTQILTSSIPHLAISITPPRAYCQAFLLTQITRPQMELI